jgi:hypothetical protein
MHLIWATEDLTIGGRPYPGFPIVLHDSLESAVEANEFLRHYLTRGTIGSEQSWPSTGRALYDYYGFLEAHGLRWSDVDRGEEKNLVAAYRDYCLTRYRPHHFPNITSSAYGPRVQDFVTGQPQQFLYLLASEFAEREIAKPSIL